MELLKTDKPDYRFRLPEKPVDGAGCSNESSNHCAEPSSFENRILRLSGVKNLHCQHIFTGGITANCFRLHQSTGDAIHYIIISAGSAFIFKIPCLDEADYLACILLWVSVNRMRYGGEDRSRCRTVSQMMAAARNIGVENSDCNMTLMKRARADTTDPSLSKSMIDPSQRPAFLNTPN